MVLGVSTTWDVMRRRTADIIRRKSTGKLEETESLQKKKSTKNDQPSFTGGPINHHKGSHEAVVARVY